MLAIGADIGGTHITTAVVDLAKRSVVSGTQKRASIDSHASADDIIEHWSQAILDSAQNFPITGIGLAMPGPFDYDQGICLIRNQDKFRNLYNKNIRSLLAERLNIPGESIATINDAAAFLDGEIFCGAARGYARAIGITLGTGLGSCTHANGRSLNADLWQMPFKEGIAEDYMSTRWFTGRFKELTGISKNGVNEIVQFSGSDDVVQILFTEFSKNLADFLLLFSNHHPADIIVIGGNIARSHPLFFNQVEHIIHAQIPNVKLSVAMLGEEAALLGAASHAAQKIKEFNS